MRRAVRPIRLRRAGARRDAQGALLLDEVPREAWAGEAAAERNPAVKVPLKRLVVHELTDDTEVVEATRLAAKLDSLHFGKGSYSDMDVWFSDRATGAEVVTSDQVDWRFHRRLSIPVA